MRDECVSTVRGKVVKVARRGSGEGTIRQRADGRWEARYRDADGKRQSVFTKSQADGIARLKAARNDRDLGLPTRSDRLTTGAFLAKWIEGVRTSVRASTWRRYEIIVRVQLLPYLGHVRLARMQPADLSAAYAKMLDAGLGREPWGTFTGFSDAGSAMPRSRASSPAIPADS